MDVRSNATSSSFSPICCLTYFFFHFWIIFYKNSSKILCHGSFSCIFGSSLWDSFIFFLHWPLVAQWPASSFLSCFDHLIAIRKECYKVLPTLAPLLPFEFPLFSLALRGSTWLWILVNVVDYSLLVPCTHKSKGLLRRIWVTIYWYYITPYRTFI